MLKNSFRKIFKILSRIIILLLVLIIIYILVPAFPHPLFKHKMEYGNLTVYSDKNFPDNFLEILDDIQFRIEKLEIYDSTFYPDIFIFIDY